MTDLPALRQLAEKATPGPWTVTGKGFTVGPSVCSVIQNGSISTAGMYIGRRGHDAAFIAAASPDVILSLLDRLEKAEAAMQKACGMATQGYLGNSGEFRDVLMDVSDVLRSALPAATRGAS